MKMSRHLVRIIFWLSLILVIPVRQGTLQGVDCASQIDETLASAQNVCPSLDFNTLCYLSSPVTISGSVNVLSQPGAKGDLASIEGVETTPIENGLAGSAVLYGQAGSSAAQQAVILLVGDVAIKKTANNTANAQPQNVALSETNLLTSIFDLSTSFESLSGCANQPPGMLIAKSVGNESAIITVSGVTITFSGVMALHMSAVNKLDLLVFNGDAWVGATAIILGQALQIGLDTENGSEGVQLSEPRFQTLDEVALTFPLIKAVNQFVPSMLPVPTFKPDFCPDPDC